jgi:hypothetical protein
MAYFQLIAYPTWVAVGSSRQLKQTIDFQFAHYNGSRGRASLTHSLFDAYQLEMALNAAGLVSSGHADNIWLYAELLIQAYFAGTALRLTGDF